MSDSEADDDFDALFNDFQEELDEDIDLNDADFIDAISENLREVVGLSEGQVIHAGDADEGKITWVAPSMAGIDGLNDVVGPDAAQLHVGRGERRHSREMAEKAAERAAEQAMRERDAELERAVRAREEANRTHAAAEEARRVLEGEDMARAARAVEEAERARAAAEEARRAYEEEMARAAREAEELERWLQQKRAIRDTETEKMWAADDLAASPVKIAPDRYKFLLSDTLINDLHDIEVQALNTVHTMAPDQASRAMQALQMIKQGSPTFRDAFQNAAAELIKSDEGHVLLQCVLSRKRRISREVMLA